MSKVEYKRNRKLLLKRKVRMCKYCKKRIKKDEISIDHVVARCNGGGDEIENLALSHKLCNQDKNNKVDAPLYFKNKVLKELGLK